MQKISRVAVLITAIFLFSCGDHEKADIDNNRSGNDMSTRLMELKSGYDPSSANWEAFLKCWHDKESQLIEADAQEDRRLIRVSRLESKASSQGATSEEFLKTIRFKLPQSYIDFISAYSALGGDFVDPENTDEPGFFNPGSIEQLSDYDSDLVVVDEQWAIESEDDLYYQYGVAQDTSSGRSSYLPKALVIGRFGISEYELMLLYPNSTTKDGEIEAAMLSHSYEFRTPSFAELMRQISVLKTENRGQLPPYSQRSILDTCANHIALNSVWWN